MSDKFYVLELGLNDKELFPAKVVICNGILEIEYTDKWDVTMPYASDFGSNEFDDLGTSLLYAVRAGSINGYVYATFSAAGFSDATEKRIVDLCYEIGAREC